MPEAERPDPIGPDRTQAAWPGLAYWARVTIVVALVLLALAQLRKAADVLALIALAAVLAVGLDPAVRFLERRGFSRGVAVLVISLSSTVAFAVFLAFAIPEFVEQAREFAQGLPSLLDRLSARDDWIGRAVSGVDIKQHLQDFIADIPSRIANSFGSIVGVTSQITGLVFRVFTVAILNVYFMLSYPKARRWLLARTPVEDRPRLDRVVTTVTTRIGGYVSGTFVLAGLASVVAALVLVTMGVRFWFPLAVWAGLAGVIPIVGAYLGAVPAVLIALAESPTKAIAVLVFFLLWQQVRDYVVSPRVMKNSVDLAPAIVMVATIVGASVAGFFGIILALPIAATIKAIAGEYMWNGESPDEVVSSTGAADEGPATTPELET